MKLVYGVKDRPKAGQIIVFALQQLLAILAATITVPIMVNSNTAGMGMAVPSELSISAALLGAGVGTIVYLLFTKFKSPVFLGSSFAFIGSMTAAFAGAYSAAMGYFGILLGAVFAGLVYVIIAIIVKFAGVKWIDKIMPAVVIGPTVAIIGLSLAGSAASQFAGGVTTPNGNYYMDVHGGLCLVCGIVTLAVTIISSVYGKKLMKMIPFVLGICAGYIVASVFTAFSYIPGAEAMRLIDFEHYFNVNNIEWYPNIMLVKMFDNWGDLSNIGSYIGTVAVAYIPVAFVTFAEHLADHKNISSIIETDLLKDPGLHRTILGDGVGSIAGAIFGGCPNTTYGESVGCVAISGNASVITILVTACMAIVVSFIGPFVALLSSIPSCVMGGVCVALYGFIAVSGLKMIQKVDLGDNKNLFVVSVILIVGVGGMSLFFGNVDWVNASQTGVTVTSIATALILGILCNLLVNIKSKKDDGNEQLAIEDAPVISEDEEEDGEVPKVSEVLKEEEETKNEEV